jgi:hypothetical protein
MVLSNDNQSTVMALVTIILIRLTSFIIITTNAFYKWKIMPRFTTTRSYLLGWAFVSVLFAVLTW